MVYFYFYKRSPKQSVSTLMGLCSPRGFHNSPLTKQQQQPAGWRCPVDDENESSKDWTVAARGDWWSRLATVQNLTTTNAKSKSIDVIMFSTTRKPILVHSAREQALKNLVCAIQDLSVELKQVKTRLESLMKFI